MSAVFDLERHAAVEASAGTGKTHTLEHLVLRLLLEHNVRLDQILLVTYTEKATGELKGRLRDRLINALRHAEAAQARLLRMALDQFDQTSIFTIHGFCQRLLQEFAFEQRQDFHPRLVSDRSLLKTCLREIQRRDWRGWQSLRLVLQLANYQGRDGTNWEKRVLDIAEHMRPLCGHKLSPEPVAHWLDELPDLEKRVHEQLVWFRELARPIREPIEEHRWYIGYCQLKTKRSEKSFKEAVAPLLHWLASAAADEQPLNSLLKLMSGVSRTFEYAISSLTRENEEQFDAVCPSLRTVLSNLDKLREQLDSGVQSNQLAAQTIMRLHERLAELKRERGLQSFEDMIGRVAQGLDGEQNPRAASLLRQLRERYRYAIVDEFQDTDPLQWRIFRRIFVEEGAARLFVVGDPKQAIFAFRGADLPTYLTAVNQLKTDHAAACHELAVNWRSTPELLHALNHLFAEGKWFDEDGLTYTRVAAPPEAERPLRVLRDDSGRAALSIIDLPGERLAQARRQFAQFSAGEIARLLRGPTIVFRRNGIERPLAASDICILVCRRREALPVIDSLKAAGIPFSFYKQSGLWQSDQAVHLGYVLRAIAQPEDEDAFHKALLTCFFRLPPQTLALVDSWPAHHPVRDLFNAWLDLAQRRHWSRLFQSLFEDTGLIFHEAECGDGERRLANYRHIFATLEQAAYAQNLDLFELLEFFEQKCRQVDDEAELQPIETDQPKVQIMTIHAAKGLEFPVVFLAGGFTQTSASRFTTYRDDAGNVIFDLAPDAAAREQAKRERQAEERRLLYVALTRAMIKLYVPSPRERGSAPGPAVTLLKPAMAACSLAALGKQYTQMQTYEPRALADGAKVTPAGINPAARLGDNLFPPIAKDLWRRRILMRSFSSLHREKTRQSAEAATFVAEPKRDSDDEPERPTAADALRGPVFGDIVHNVLEQFDFALAGQAAEPAALIQPGHPFRLLLDEELQKNVLSLRTRVSRSAIEDACRQLVAEMTWKTLRTPLTALGCALWQIPKEDRLAEIEFLFPEEADPSPLLLSPRGRGEGVRGALTFITGFMDLVMRRQGRFFLLDWKSNLLPGYSGEEVARSMQESDYLTQYRLYVHALSRWLTRLRGDFDCQRDFGGVYYLYLRGMNGRDDSSGVYFARPGHEELALTFTIG